MLNNKGCSTHFSTEGVLSSSGIFFPRRNFCSRRRFFSGLFFSGDVFTGVDFPWRTFFPRGRLFRERLFWGRLFWGRFFRGRFFRRRFFQFMWDIIRTLVSRLYDVSTVINKIERGRYSVWGKTEFLFKLSGRTTVYLVHTFFKAYTILYTTWCPYYKIW